MSDSNQQKKINMCKNILNEIRFLRKNADAIEYESLKGINHGIFDGGYVTEKLEKARSALDEIERDIRLKGERMY